jgi:dTDP-4-dehydrorhamnose 3,5-epimerase
MKVSETHIAGLLVIEPRVFNDERGFFYESYNCLVLKEKGVDIHFVQDNHSSSQYGVLRGLHFQKAPHAQTKLVRVIRGSVLDVAVDVRRGSPTFGQHFALELTAENKKQMLIPKGFAHGFIVLSKEAEFLYKCDNYYHKASESGIRFDDPFLNIDWGIPAKDIILSEKDNELPFWEDADFNFEF